MIARLRELVAADRALAVNSLREIRAGVDVETPEYDVANNRVIDAEEALPRVLQSVALRWSGWVNRDLWNPYLAILADIDKEVPVGPPAGSVHRRCGLGWRHDPHGETGPLPEDNWWCPGFPLVVEVKK